MANGLVSVCIVKVLTSKLQDFLLELYTVMSTSFMRFPTPK
jgi:hypothetical protein